MNKNTNFVSGRGVGMKMMAGSWCPNGTGAVDNTLNVNDWFTVTRTGVGLYLLSLRDLFVDVYGMSFAVNCIAGGTLYHCTCTSNTGVSLKTLVSTTGVVQLAITDDAGAAADPAANAANRVHMIFVMKNSVGR